MLGGLWIDVWHGTWVAGIKGSEDAAEALHGAIGVAKVGDGAQQLTQVQQGHALGPARRRGVKFLVKAEETPRWRGALAAPQHGQVDFGPGVGDGGIDNGDPAVVPAEQVP